MKTLKIAPGTLLCSMPPVQVLAQITYKCTDTSGKSVYQDVPRRGSVRRSIPNEAAKEAAANRMTEKDWGVRNVLFEYANCTRAFPALVGKFSGGYFAWSSKNAASIEKVQATSEHATLMKNIEAAQAARAKVTQAMRDAGRAECECLLERA